MYQTHPQACTDVILISVQMSGIRNFIFEILPASKICHNYHGPTDRDRINPITEERVSTGSYVRRTDLNN